MAGTFLQAVLARLSLGLAVLMAVSPAQAFVLCLRPDGSVALEVPSPAGSEESCGPCDPCCGPDPIGPEQRTISGPDCCDCLDVAFQERSAAATVVSARAPSSANAALAPAPPVPRMPLAGAIRAPGLRVVEATESPGVLAHLRTIVLRV